MRSRRHVRYIGLVAVTSALALGGTSTVFAASSAGGEVTTVGGGADTRSSFSAHEVRLMAASSGLSFAEQDQLLERQEQSNEVLDDLRSSGLDFDGAFLDGDGSLVVRAESGSSEARAATAAGAEVQDARFGETDLAHLQGLLAATDLGGVAALELDVPGDRLVVRSSDDLSAEVQSLVDRYSSAVTVVDAPANTTTVGFRGGDGLWQGGGYCSAGFPARNSAGTRFMIWAGHCNEGGGSFTLGNGGPRVMTSVASAFRSYDGQPDRDIGYTRIDAEDSLSTNVNPYGSGRNVNAPNGASRPAVGTQLCKSGATTGVTCGQILSYNNTVNYVDSSGRQQASVSGLMRSSVCTDQGDSGGAYTAGGFAVGLTSGGPVGQTCTFDGGFQSGKSSYVQPVTDALAYYGLTYGG